MSTHTTTDAGAKDAHAADDHGGHAQPHAVPIAYLLGTFALLMLLTGLTVGVTYVDLGPLNIWVALLVAVVKAGLVAMFFMHLRWDSPFNGIILIASLLFVAIFMGITLLDSHNYQINMDPAPGSNLTVQQSSP